MGKKTKGNGQRVTENIWLCPDGVYRWTYEFDMLRNPTILFTVWKVLGISFGVVFLFVLILDIVDGSFAGVADLWPAIRGFLILALIFLVISIIAYAIVAGIYGWKYQVLFEMTDEKVTHIQMPRQFKRAEALGWVTALVGAVSGNPTMAGIGLTTAARSTQSSDFASVTSVRVRRNRNTIHVDYIFDRNQVYAEDADFDFVEKFILDRCVKAKRK